jgi:hypothetical protein
MSSSRAGLFEGMPTRPAEEEPGPIKVSQNDKSD